jgi:hypothetical protein
MISSNSSIDWTKIMTETNKDEYVKTAEFREWLMGLLSDGSPTTITFTKKDGTDRVMKCTTNPTYIMFKDPSILESKSDRKVNEDVMPVFDLDAVRKVREYMMPYPPSSPSIALFKDGQLVHMIERHNIEGRSAQMIADNLVGAFDAYCN